MTGSPELAEPFAPHCVVLSSIGARNVGDEAMLLGVVSGLRRRIPDVRISVVSATPLDPVVRHALGGPSEFLSSYSAFRFRVRWQKAAKRVPIVGGELTNELTALLVRLGMRGKWGARLLGLPTGFASTVKACRTADAVVDIGGANINGIWSSSFFDKATLASLAMAETPVFHTGQGVETLVHPMGRRRLRRLAKNSEAFWVREQASLDTTLRSGVPPGEVSLTGDDAFHLRPTSEPVRKEPYIAVQFRKYLEYVEEEALVAFADALDAVSERTGVRLVGIPMHFGHRDERHDLAEIRARMNRAENFEILQDELAVQDALDLVDRALVSIGMSHHFAVFSVITGTPAITLVHGAHYEHKMRGLTEQFPATLTAHRLLESAPHEVAATCVAKMDSGPVLRSRMMAERIAVTERVESSLDQVLDTIERQIVA